MKEEKILNPSKKTEIRMYVWYLITEPFRRIARFFKMVDNTITPSFLMYLYLIFGV